MTEGKLIGSSQRFTDYTNNKNHQESSSGPQIKYDLTLATLSLLDFCLNFFTPLPSSKQAGCKMANGHALIPVCAQPGVSQRNGGGVSQSHTADSASKLKARLNAYQCLGWCIGPPKTLPK